MNESSYMRSDSHGSNPLSDNNTVGSGPGIKGNAASFVTANREFLSRTDNPAISTGDIDFTLSANVYLNSTTNIMILANKGLASSSIRDFVLYYNPTGSKFVFSVGNGTVSGSVSSNESVTAGQWYRVIAWHDSVNNTLNIQVNNGAPASVAYSSGAMDTTYPLTIGAHADGAGTWNGRIDEVFLYKRVLRADERTWLYNNGQGRSYVEVQPVPSSSALHLTYAATVSGCMGGGRTIAHAVSAMGSSNTYTYDCNGNQTRHISGSDTYDISYDAENRLSQVKKNNTMIASFTYDGDGNRVKSVLGTETTLFIGGHYEVTNPGAGQTVTKYYFAGATRVAMRKYTIPQSMTVEYFLSDHLGSTSITTDSAGAKVSEIGYKPWGEIRYAWTSGTATTPSYKLASYTYTGQYSDSYINLLWYGSRHYDPAIGRFIQPDSIVPDLYNPQDWNRYAYARYNPLVYTDPTGHDPVLGFIGGFLKEFARTNLWFDPQAQKDLAIHNNESTAELTGRLVADVASMAIGATEAGGGAGVAGGGVVACGTGVGCLVTPGGLVAGGALIAQGAGTTLDAAFGAGKILTMLSKTTRGGNDEGDSYERSWRQDRILTDDDLGILEDHGYDIHDLKGGDKASRYDLYKDRYGNVYVKLKGGKGPGEDIRINLHDLLEGDDQ